jgi:hypothetical protein
LSTSNEYSLPFPLTKSRNKRNNCSSSSDVNSLTKEPSIPEERLHQNNKKQSDKIPAEDTSTTVVDVVVPPTPFGSDFRSLSHYDACDSLYNDDHSKVQLWPKTPKSNSSLPISTVLLDRRPLFEDIINKEHNRVNSALCLLPSSQERCSPFGRHELLHHAAALRCGAKQSPPVDSTSYQETSPWPTASVIRDSRVTSCGGGLFERYNDTHDIQTRLPWVTFKKLYQESMDSFNWTAGSGAYGQRVIIHAHHMASEQGAPAGQPPQFGESVPRLNQLKMATHFKRAVECTGLNLSLIVVPRSCMSLFDAVSSCMYAVRSDVPPRPAFGLMRACITWLLNDQNVLKSMTMRVTGQNNSHLNKTCTVLDALCASIVSSDTTATSSLGPNTSVSQRLVMYKKHLIKLKKIDEYDLLKVNDIFPSKLNSVFVQVLCEIFCETITVIDFVRRAVKTYTATSGVKDIANRNLFIYQVDNSGEYFYGIINNDKCMTAK